LQVSAEKTIFMQKAIYYVSRILAARGILELTDRCLNFQVSSLDASFGIKDVSIELLSITDVMISGGDFHPRVVVVCDRDKYEFVLSRAQELYDLLKQMLRNPVSFSISGLSEDEVFCKCGRSVNKVYNFCPWCGRKLSS